MEKRKYDLSKYADMYETKEFEGKDGVKVTVRNHIPYAAKKEIASSMAETLLMIHDEAIIYLSNLYDMIEKYMIVKYYTDVEIEDITEENAADFLINNDLYDRIEEYIWSDLMEVRRMFDMIEASVTKTYEHDKSLAQAVRTSFGFLFTGEDITESMAKAEATRDSLFDAINALKKIDKEKEEKIDNGKLSLGGNVINFAKKKE